MSMVEIHHTDGNDPATTRLRAVLCGRELAALELRWADPAAPTADDDAGRLEILRLAVDPGVRGRGVAGRLFERLAAVARDRGIRRIDATVHHAAADAFTALGFRAVAEPFWDGSRRFVPMSVDLASSREALRRAEVAAAISRLGPAALGRPSTSRHGRPSARLAATA